MAGGAFQTFFKVLFMATTLPCFTAVTTAAENIASLNQSGGLIAVAAEAGYVPASMILMHRLPLLAFLFMAQSA